ncbi:hypothetical protein [Stenotrophomonas sp. SY1]|uniref:hypothetical protein n=1 Tax=Stenotrophomonas sp. SY1 TaxID=477235 RepID=UPI001E599464|nr:hypothetical protein [Stenotrophomonas sp. SY1]MCD9087333.1 hypothetical protein [Stenotrophomonas sp. SY1]
MNEDLMKENLDSVLQELDDMLNGRGMVAANHEDSCLQGDIYDGVNCVVRIDGQVSVRPQRVLLVSNSCDASPDNRRQIPLDLTVAPLLRLSRYREMLVANGVSEQAATDMVTAIKRQQKTDLVFVPAGAGLEEDMVALLDKVQSLPSAEFIQGAPPRLAVLTQRGFWVLLVKLSMHFLRPHEGVARSVA